MIPLLFSLVERKEFVELFDLLDLVREFLAFIFYMYFQNRTHVNASAPSRDGELSLLCRVVMSGAPPDTVARLVAQYGARIDTFDRRGSLCMLLFQCQN